MLYKRGKHGQRPAARPSLLGDGLLERARATSLALLGATAAVGLAIVALALNQGWPLIAGSAVPPLQPREQAIGPAAVADRAAGARSGHAGTLGPGGQRHDRATRSGAIAVSTGASQVTGPADEHVVSPSQPVESGESHHPAPPPHPKAPSAPQLTPQAPTNTVASSPPTPVPEPAPAAPIPAPEPVSVPVTTPPVTTVSETPPEEESDLPPWSHGHGHGYGHGEGWHDHGWGDDED